MADRQRTSRLTGQDIIVLLHHCSSLRLVHEDQASTKTRGGASSGRWGKQKRSYTRLHYRAWQISGDHEHQGHMDVQVARSRQTEHMQKL